MSWEKLLKNEERKPNPYKGKRHPKDDGDTFVEDFGFMSSAKPHKDDKHPIVRDEQGNLLDENKTKKEEVVNWFKVFLNETFETMLDNIADTPREELNLGAMAFRQGPIDSTKKVKKLGLQLTQKYVDKMVEEYLDTIINTEFDDDEQNIQRLFSSTGLNKIVKTAYKFIETMFSGYFDTAYQKVKQMKDWNYDTLETMNIDPNMALSPQMQDKLVSFFNGSKNTISEIQVDSVNTLINEIDDIFETSDFAEFGETTDDVTNKLKINLNAGMKQVMEDTRDLTEEFIANLTNAFLFKYIPILQALEDSQTTEQDEVEDRPEIKYGEEYGQARRKFEDKYKSNDKYTGELDWKSQLQKEVALTSNAGFTPAIHNTMYGEKKPCKSCKNKRTPCGCK